MKNLLLSGIWNLYYYNQKEFNINTPTELKKADVSSIKATVPGNIELDLSKAGLLPKDLFKGENIRTAKEFESYDWWYETEFETPEFVSDKKCFLRFGGVDCYAEYWLNGINIGSSENMLIPTELDVTDKLLVKGKNHLLVHIRSAVFEAKKMDLPSYSIINIWSNKYNNFDSVLTRKAPHGYGWDIMPRALLGGIWKDAELVAYEEYDIKQLYVFCSDISEKSAKINVTFELDAKDTEGMEMKIEGKCGDSEFSFNCDFSYKAWKKSFKLENPKLWWPYGYGEPNLYDTKVTFYKNKKEVSKKEFKLGIRSVRLDRTDTTDGVNGNFEFFINDTPIMCKGSNWVPLDAFHSRDKERFNRAMELVSDIGCNILRCWGGNVYESKEFYDYCDEHGIMVWQDFAMACHAYPQDERFKKLIKEEAEVVIKERRQHPSVILWSGDNECDVLLITDGANPNDNIITREVLKRAVAENDIGRPYLPSSPYISEEVYKKGDLSLMPEDHLWGARDYYKSPYYAAPKCHFVSESGYHGCPSLESIKKFIDEDYIWPLYNNPQWNLHSTDMKGEDNRVMLMEKQVRQLFGKMPEDIEDFIFASQISQAEAKKFFIENIRTHRETKKGIIWWNLLDGWPQMSDAVVDYYFDKKIAYDYIKRSQQPFALMCTEIYDWNTTVIGTNDTREVKKGTYIVTNAEDGKVVAEGDFCINPGTNDTLCKIPLMYSEKGMLLIEWIIDGKRYINHYLYGFPGFELGKYKEWFDKIK